ncbi:hypothetical protein [Aequorivita capsosiphonis]|uniref:hypothetical protein n=1 Tax=Aequorivita capsosiphonis TaxID=487317 RepID=UPI0004027F5E|nr:hypothetical protein [Aequorivita capsosiphonis]
MRTYLQFSILLLLILTCGSSAIAQGISMSPTRLFFTGSPGETVSLPVILSNSSDIDYVFNVNTKDWKREEDGNKVYFDPNTLENSNSSWVSTIESSVNLPAKNDKEIMVTMKIPANASTSEVTNAMLFFTQIGKQKDIADQQKGIGIITLFEFGLHVYYTPLDNTNLSLDIVSIKNITAETAAAPKVAVGIENDGNLVNDATVELELTNTSTGEELKLNPINISMLPGTKQVVNFQLPEGLSGSYLGVSIIKMAGTNDLRVGEKTFEF